MKRDFFLKKTTCTDLSGNNGKQNHEKNSRPIKNNFGLIKINHFILSALLVLLMSCKDDDTNVKYDFSLLGIEQIIVDETVINTDSSGFPEKDNESYVIVGFSYSDNSPSRSYDLTIYKTMPEEISINIKSKYDGISTVIEKNADSGYYNIIVSRKGFDEKIVYKIGFMKVPI